MSDLIGHEETQPDKVKTHAAKMLRRGTQKRPVVVHYLDDERKYLIIDGHHRVAALKELGYQYVIANRIDYLSSEIKVKSWQGAKEWDKKDIIEQALRGNLRGPKTTKHVIMMGGKEVPFHKNDEIEPVINYPLEKLK